MVGKTCARHYRADPVLRAMADHVRSHQEPLITPYPWLHDRLRTEAERVHKRR